MIREGISRGDIRNDLPLHLLRDLFFGTLEHAARSYLVRGQDPKDEPAIKLIARQVMAMVRGAMFTARRRHGPDQDGRLEAVAKRLEAVADRLDGT